MLKEHEAGMKALDLCRKYGVSDATFYKYKAKFGGMTVSDAKKLRALEDENAKLKRLLAETMLDNAVLKGSCDKKLLTPDVKRRAVRHAIEAHGLSERRACRLAELDRSTFQYQKQPGNDEDLRMQLRELTNERRRFGYRRLNILLDREGIRAKYKKVFRIYREEGLAVRRRSGRKRAVGTRQPILLPDSSQPALEPGLCPLTFCQTGGGSVRCVVVDDFSRVAIACRQRLVPTCYGVGYVSIAYEDATKALGQRHICTTRPRRRNTNLDRWFNTHNCEKTARRHCHQRTDQPINTQSVNNTLGKHGQAHHEQLFRARHITAGGMRPNRCRLRSRRASIPATAHVSSLSEVSPVIPTAPTMASPSRISTPPGTGTNEPPARPFMAWTK